MTPAEFEAAEWAIGLAALARIEVRVEWSDDGPPAFTVLRFGEPTACRGLDGLRATLGAMGVPMLTPTELRERAVAVLDATAQAIEDALAPRVEH